MWNVRRYACEKLLRGRGKSVAVVLLSAALLPVDLTHAQNNTTSSANQGDEWNKVELAFDQFFQQLPGHRPPFVITRTDVEPLWPKLAQAGWQVRGKDDLVSRIPGQGEFLVRQLRTASGRNFMERIVPKYPEIYDRLDMLANTPGGGQPAVSGIVAAKDAELTVRYMFTPAGEHSWSSMLPQRKTFAKPTGRIYTAELLKTALHKLYLEEHAQ